MITIVRVLNNNAISAVDETGNEVILKGKGIAFRKSAGDVVEESHIEQRFILENQEIQRRYKEILKTIPMDVLDTSEAIIAMIKANSSKAISDMIYITLSDHIANLLERLQKGIAFDSLVLWDMKRLYPDEYALALQAVSRIRSDLDIAVDEQEAGFITLHIVNAQMNLEMKETCKVTELIAQITQLVCDRFHLVLEQQDELSYHRFLLHLRFFLERYYHQQAKANLQKNDILSVMKRKYKKQYECVEEILALIHSHYENEVSEDEKLYLLIHIAKLTS